VTLGSLSLDGEFGYSRFQDGLKQWAVKKGTSAAYNGKTFFSSSQPITLALDMSNTAQYKGHVSRDSSEGEVVLEIANPSGAVFNGQPVSVTNVKGFVRLTVAASGALIIDYGSSSLWSRVPWWCRYADVIFAVVFLFVFVIRRRAIMNRRS
jgi:hypothetical protein